MSQSTTLRELAPQPRPAPRAGAGAARGGRRIGAIDALSGSLTEVYGQLDYLADLRADWPP